MMIFFSFLSTQTSLPAYLGPSLDLLTVIESSLCLLPVSTKTAANFVGYSFGM